MSLRCKSCGFESADGSKWCDFCKEPFQPKKKPDELQPEKVLAMSPTELKKALASDWAPPPAFTPLARNLAIAFLTFMLLMAFIAGTLLMMGSQKYNGPGDDIKLGKPQIISVPDPNAPPVATEEPKTKPAPEPSSGAGSSADDSAGRSNQEHSE